MLFKAHSAAVYGIDANLIDVEVDYSGVVAEKDVFHTVGLPDAAVRESRDRVRAAIKNSGYLIPPTHITINLAPADMKKEGAGFDLPIAVGILGAYGALRTDDLSQFLLVGELGLDGGGVLVGHVGRFEEVKNHDFLLRSFAALSRRFPDVRLVLAGDGPLRTRVMRQASATGLRDRVDFLGVVPHIPRLLAALDLFLFPSRWEGLGLALVEAQAAGIPCLVSDRVPREADIGLGLTVFRSLEDGPAAWADASAGLIGALPPLWPDRLKALRAGGYDIDSLARALSLVYSGAVPAVRI